MNAFEFMDKQIMDLSRSMTGGSDNDFINLINPSPAIEADEKAAESSGDPKKEELHASFHFQPIRPADVLSRSIDSFPTRSYGRLSSADADRVVLGKPLSANDAAVVSEIDHALKRHTDNTLRVIDGLSARLSQTETRIRELEHSVDDIKLSIGNNHGSTDGKLRQMENMLQEVKSCMRDLKDKQEVMDTRLQLEKLLVSKADKTPETQNPGQNLAPAAQSAVPVTQRSTQQFPNTPLQSLPAASPQLATHPTMQPPTPMPSGPRQDTYIPADQPQEAPSQQYLLPPAQPQEPSPSTPYPQVPHPPERPRNPAPPINPPPPQHQLSMAHYIEEDYIPSQTYLPDQHLYNAPPSHMHESPTGKSGSGFSSSAYTLPTGPCEPYPYGRMSSHYGNNPATRQQRHSSGGGGNYPQTPTARTFPQAIPTASPVGSATNSGGSGNRDPIDDLIDEVTDMGFDRKEVRDTVRRLAGRGQLVDWNAVLDKLMKDTDVQPPRGWFRR